MHVLSLRTLRDFWSRPGCEDAEIPLRAWHALTRRATWQSFADIREGVSRSADVVGNRVVFDIGGNKYRLVVFVDYSKQRVYVKWIGTHREYDRIDVMEV